MTDQDPASSIDQLGPQEYDQDRPQGRSQDYDQDRQQLRSQASDDPITGLAQVQDHRRRRQQGGQQPREARPRETDDHESDGTFHTRPTPAPIPEEFEEDDNVVTIPSPPSNTELFGCEVRTPPTQNHPQISHNMSRQRSQRGNIAFRVTTAPPAETGPEIKPITINGLNLHNLPSLEKREDYQQWARRMKLTIDLIGASDLLDGYEVEHKVPISQLETWRIKQRQCVGILNETLSLSLSDLLSGEKTVLRVFQRLKEEFQSSGLSALQTAYQEWEECVYSESITVRDYAQKISTVQEKFIQVGAEHKLPPSHLVLKFVNGLSENYAGWCTTFWANHNIQTVPKLEDVISSAEAEEARQRSGVATNNAFHANLRKRPAASPPDGETRMVKRPYCTHCKKTGHNKAGCFDLRPDLRKKWEERRGYRPRQEEPSNPTPNQTMGLVLTEADQKATDNHYVTF